MNLLVRRGEVVAVCRKRFPRMAHRLWSKLLKVVEFRFALGGHIGKGGQNHAGERALGGRAD